MPGQLIFLDCFRTEKRVETLRIPSTYALDESGLGAISLSIRLMDFLISISIRSALILLINLSMIPSIGHHDIQGYSHCLNRCIKGLSGNGSVE